MSSGFVSSKPPRVRSLRLDLAFPSSTLALSYTLGHSHVTALLTSARALNLIRGGVGDGDTNVEVVSGGIAFSRARSTLIISWYAMSPSGKRLSNSLGGGASLAPRLVSMHVRGYNL